MTGVQTCALPIYEVNNAIHVSGNRISHINFYENTEIKIFINIESVNKYALKVNAYEL